MDSPQPLDSVNFICKACKHSFIAVPDRVEEVADRDWQPFDYFAKCPACGAEAPQAYWALNLAKSHHYLRTPEGAAKMTQNLPKPDSPAGQIARFNALKHGLSARTATYFPARPGQYAQCDGCEYMNNGCGTEHKACMKRAELFMRFQVATETGDATMLRILHSDNQAALQALISDMVIAISKAGGPEIKKPIITINKESGQAHVVQYIDENGKMQTAYDVMAHPLLKHLIDFIDRNKMTLGDMGMTTKAQEDNAILKGNLADQADKREALVDYQRQQAESMQRLEHLINRGSRQTLIEADRGE